MIALGIRYLRGVSVATDVSNQTPEWPPHPGRVHMAMAAALFESGADPDERAALEWLELEPPALRASDATPRSAYNSHHPVESYVPVNDGHNGILRRSRQPRTFQIARPVEDTVYLLWNTAPSDSQRSALARLCSRVTRIGHSSSLVQMWVVTPGQEPQPNWLPSNNASTYFRIAPSGTLTFLEQAFNGHAILDYEDRIASLQSAKGKEKKRLQTLLNQQYPSRPSSQRPQLASWQGYSRAETVEHTPVLDSPFDPNLLIFTKLEGRNLGLESTLQLTGALRDAAMKSCPQQPPPEWLSGHTPDGAPSLSPHAAFLPLPFVGSKHADGHIMGLAIAIPRTVPEAHLQHSLGPLLFDSLGNDRTIRLWRNAGPELAWEWLLARETRPRPGFNLQLDTWTAPSRTWASVTPVVLHHYPKKGSAADVERILKEAFASALLPQPETIAFQSVSRFDGVGHVTRMPFFNQGDSGLSRYQTHVEVTFPLPVRGPVLVGRGRYRGYGLFRPVSPKENGQ